MSLADATGRSSVFHSQFAAGSLRPCNQNQRRIKAGKVWFPTCEDARNRRSPVRSKRQSSTRAAAGDRAYVCTFSVSTWRQLSLQHDILACVQIPTSHPTAPPAPRAHSKTPNRCRGPSREVSATVAARASRRDTKPPNHKTELPRSKRKTRAVDPKPSGGKTAGYNERATAETAKSSRRSSADN